MQADRGDWEVIATRQGHVQSPIVLDGETQAVKETDRVCHRKDSSTADAARTRLGSRSVRTARSRPGGRHGGQKHMCP